MCQFGPKEKIISIQDLTRENALVGYRNWYINNSFNDLEKHLKSTNIDFLWPKGEEVKGNPLEDNSKGVYNYNYYNYNNNYNNNYNYYNNYNNNYNYNYYYNNYNNNYYSYYNNYYICGKTLLYGKVFHYKEGYRSSICIPTHLIILSDKEWFTDKYAVKFANHFNSIVTNLAKEYNCKVIEYIEYSK
jgi:hypothetical protein